MVTSWAANWTVKKDTHTHKKTNADHHTPGETQLQANKGFIPVLLIQQHCATTETVPDLLTPVA